MPETWGPAHPGARQPRNRLGSSGGRSIGRNALEHLHDRLNLFFEAYGPAATRLAEAGCRPASTLLGVTRLAFPELLVESEATAVV